MLAALIPVLNRPKNVAPLVESFLSNSSELSRLFFIVSADDHAEIDEIAKFEGKLGDRVFCFVVDDYAIRWSQKLNAAHRVFEGDARHQPKWFQPEWYLLGADDLAFHKGWDDNPKLNALMQDIAIGVIGTNDLGNPAVRAGVHSTHPLVRRKYVEEQGIMEGLSMIAPECYHHNFVDNEICGLAFKRKAYAHCHESIIEHMHPAWRKADSDETYKLGMSRFHEDGRLYQVREMLYGLPKLEER